MKLIRHTLLACSLMIFSSLTSAAYADSKPLPKLAQNMLEATKDFDKIPAVRKTEIKKIADYIIEKLKTEKKVSLIYICVHNSDRSFMGQLWATAAASYYGIKGVNAYSGGLIITAFNPNVIKALNGQGYQIVKTFDTANPRYDARYSADAAPVVCFSKKYMDTPNPVKNFAAVTTCTEADESCPLVQGASLRVSTPYKAVRDADGKPNQDEVYSERSKQMETEILYCFSLVKAAGL